MTTTSSAPPTRSGRVQELLTHLTLWMAAATLAAFLHLAGARIINLGFSIHRWGWDSRDLIWQVPLAYVLIFAPVAIGLALLGTFVLHHAGRRLALWTWTTLVLFSFLLLFPEIHGYASLLLAAGAAISLSGLLRRRWPATLRAATLRRNWDGRHSDAGRSPPRLAAVGRGARHRQAPGRAR